MPFEPGKLFDSGKTITFYSYKGGTGRTMALANAAVLLAREQSKDRRGILMIDWDLEAPGLHRFFRNQLKSITGGTSDPDAKIDKEEGLLDFFWQLKKATSKYNQKSPQRQAEARELLESIKPESFVLRTDVAGDLSLLKAGRIDDDYSQKVNTFAWEDFYNRAPWLIRSFGERLAKQYRYILIDSRTGLTDVSGICTMLLPEILVFVFTPNRQSIEGGLSVIRRATNYRLKSSDLRPLVVFPLASRVDPTREKLMETWRYGDATGEIKGFEPQFEQLFKSIYQLEQCSLKEYFNEIQIQHTPDYAYGESIAVEAEGSGARLSLKRSYVTFVDRLINSPSPWQKEQPTPKQVEPSDSSIIVFPNGSMARVVYSTTDLTYREILKALNLNSVSALVIIVGTANDNENQINEPMSMLGHPLARFIAETNASVLDAGIERGLSKLVGEAVSQRSRSENVIGVAPRGCVSYPQGLEPVVTTNMRLPLDPNHTHFVLSQGNRWGDEIDTKYDLARELGKEVPVICIVAGGSSTVLHELLQIIKQHWPILVMEGSGGLADQIASYASRVRKPSNLPADPTLQEIVNEGNISIVPKTVSPLVFEQMCYRVMPGGPTLEMAWQNFAELDNAAERWQSRSRALRFSFLGLASIGGAAVAAPYIVANAGFLSLPEIQRWLPQVFLVTMAALFQYHQLLRPDKRARELRFVAESVKSEIYKYRSRIGEYATAGISSKPVGSALLRTLDELRSVTGLGGDFLKQDLITQRHQLAPAYKSIRLDDGFSFLTPEQYLSTRLDEQLEFHRQRSSRSSKRLEFSTILILTLLVGGAAFGFFASGKTLAIFCITMTLVLVILGITESSKLSQTAQVSGIIAKDLSTLKHWWFSVSAEDKLEAENFQFLVRQTEKIIKNSWQVAGFAPIFDIALKKDSERERLS